MSPSVRTLVGSIASRIRELRACWTLGSSKLLHFRHAQSPGASVPSQILCSALISPLVRFRSNLFGEKTYDTPWSTLFERYCSAEIEILQPRSIWQALPLTSSVCSGFNASPHGFDGIGKTGRDYGSRRGSKSGQS